MNLIEDILLYIENNKNSLEDQLQNEDGADSIVPYLEGAIEVSEHYLLKFQEMYNGK